MTHYKVKIWANEDDKWFAKATFTPFIGNTMDAQKVAFNALKNLKRRLRQEIIKSGNATNSHIFKWEIVNNQETSLGQLVQLTVTEKSEDR